MYNEALKYLKQGLSPIPCVITKDGDKFKKQPIVDWKKYQDVKPTEEDLNRWFNNANPPNSLGTVTGTISKIVVVDIDVGHNKEEVKKLRLPPTRTASTISGGYHLYYKHPQNGIKIKTIANFRKGVDIRGDGGFIVLPPSGVSDEHRYHWQTEDECAELPDSLVTELTDGKQERKNWSKIVYGMEEGSRNQGAASVAGLLLRYLPPHTWKSFALPLVMQWNEQNNPPMDKYELKMVFESIASKEFERRYK